MDIDRGGFQMAMAEEALNRGQVDTGFVPVGGPAVAQSVRRDGLVMPASRTRARSVDHTTFEVIGRSVWV